MRNQQAECNVVSFMHVAAFPVDAVTITDGCLSMSCPGNRRTRLKYCVTVFIKRLLPTPPLPLKKI